MNYKKISETLKELEEIIGQMELLEKAKQRKFLELNELNNQKNTPPMELPAKQINLIPEDQIQQIKTSVARTGNVENPARRGNRSVKMGNVIKSFIERNDFYGKDIPRRVLIDEVQKEYGKTNKNFSLKTLSNFLTQKGKSDYFGIRFIRVSNNVYRAVSIKTEDSIPAQYTEESDLLFAGFEQPPIPKRTMTVRQALHKFIPVGEPLTYEEIIKKCLDGGLTGVAKQSISAYVRISSRNFIRVRDGVFMKDFEEDLGTPSYSDMNSEPTTITTMTNRLKDLLLNESLPLDIINRSNGDIIIPANSVIDNAGIDKIVDAYDFIYVDPSPIQQKIYRILDAYKNSKNKV